jgi:hypothetical protein
MGPLGDLTIKPSPVSSTVTTTVPARNLTPVAISPGFPDMNLTNSSPGQIPLNSSENQSLLPGTLNKSG